MGGPFFSVVIDNYNYGRYLAQAIDSVLAQDFPAGEREIIVIDDGSTDESGEILGRYKGKIRAILQENRGQSGAFASGFAAARGQVVCLLDSDDYWEPDKLGTVADKLAQTKAGIIQHYQRDVDAAGKPLKNIIPEWPAGYTLADSLAGRIHYSATSSLAFRRQILDAVLPVPREIFFLYDNYLIDHGLFHTDIANIPRILGYHRVHGANNWARGHVDAKKLAGNIRELKAFRRYLEPKVAARGLSFSPEYLAVQDMEIMRREILIAMYQGDRAGAFRAWGRLVARYGRTPFGFFRSAMSLLVLVSPTLYARLYEFYGTREIFGRWRRRLLPFE